jgi:signal transduction histidine kinase
MQENRLFNRTRIRIALWYSGVMAIILIFLGLGVYSSIVRLHLLFLNRELESITKTLHNSLELKLSEPGEVEDIVQKLLPDICLNGYPCFVSQFMENKKNCPVNTVIVPSINQSSNHLFSLITDGNYYLRLWNLQGCLVGFAGNPPSNQNFSFLKAEQIIKDTQGNKYKQITIILHTYDEKNWGYIQVGRSMKELNNYLNTLKLVFFFGVPIALGLILFSSWWLAGLSMKPIYQSYKQIEQFSGDVAHELKTPLTAIQTTVESILRLPYINSEEVQEVLTTIERQNKRLIKLVQDLLLLSRLDYQSVPLDFESCCLNEIINDLVEELGVLATNKNIELIVKEDEEKSLYVMGNLDQLYRLFSNLITNAIQYTLPNGKVTILLQKQNSYGLIVIEDTGIGISAEAQKRIFDRFYRVNDDRSRFTGGYGLGLAIAQAITKKHQAHLSVKSKVGEGSIFIFKILIKE